MARECSTVVRATSLICGVMQSWSVKTPKPMNIKCGVDDYLSDIVPSARIRDSRPKWGRPGACVKYYSRVVCSFFFFCDPKFCSRPETKPQNRFLRGLFRTMSTLDYCIPRGIKMQKVSVIPMFTAKTHPSSRNV